MKTAQTLKLPAQADHDGLLKLLAAVKRDAENYACGPAARAALAEYEATKR